MSDEQSSLPAGSEKEALRPPSPGNIAINSGDLSGSSDRRRGSGSPSARNRMPLTEDSLSTPNPNSKHTRKRRPRRTAANHPQHSPGPTRRDGSPVDRFDREDSDADDFSEDEKSENSWDRNRNRRNRSTGRREGSTPFGRGVHTASTSRLLRMPRFRLDVNPPTFPSYFVPPPRPQSPVGANTSSQRFRPRSLSSQMSSGIQPSQPQNVSSPPQGVLPPPLGIPPAPTTSLQTSGLATSAHLDTPPIHPNSSATSPSGISPRSLQSLPSPPRRNSSAGLRQTPSPAEFVSNPPPPGDLPSPPDFIPPPPGSMPHPPGSLPPPPGSMPPPPDFIPLPPSFIPPPSDSIPPAPRGVPQTQDQRPMVSYLSRVRELVPFMPHLANVLRNPRNSACGKGFFFDVIEAPNRNFRVPKRRQRMTMGPNGEVIAGFAHPSGAQLKSYVGAGGAAFPFHALKPSPVAEHPTITTRFILISDLTPTIIEGLGSTFWMNPEFFEAHLHGSGYGELYESIPPSKSWNTHGARKPFISMRWLRPADRQKYTPMTVAERSSLLKNARVEVKLDKVHGAVEERLEIPTNIFRKEIHLVSNPDITSQGPNTILETDTFPAAWEERVTLHYSKVGKSPATVIVLLDPPPLVRRKETSSDTVQTQANSRQPRFHQESLIPLCLPYKRTLPEVGARLSHVFNGTPLSSARIRQLGPVLRNNQGDTLDELSKWLDNSDRKDAGMSVVTEIFKIASRDTLELLKSVGRLLHEIEDDASKDHILQNRLTYWRGLLLEVRRELTSVQTDFVAFRNFIATFNSWDDDKDFRSMIDNISISIEQIEKKQASIRADMALLENKRGIAEAESVGKLTELGFIFIPISCVAAIFSMQIQELQEAVPASSFVAAAFLTVALAYAVRVSFRSSALASTKRKVAEQIRAERSIVQGSPIRTRDFLVYLIHQKKVQRSAVVLMMFLIVVPFALVWTREKIDAGYKSMMLLLGIITVASSYFFLAQPNWFEILPSITGLKNTRRPHARRSTSTDPENPRTADRDSESNSAHGSTRPNLWNSARAKANPLNFGRLGPLFRSIFRKASDTEAKQKTDTIIPIAEGVNINNSPRRSSSHREGTSTAGVQVN